MQLWRKSQNGNIIISSVRSNSSLNRATTTGINTWTFLSLAIPRILLAQNHRSHYLLHAQKSDWEAGLPQKEELFYTERFQEVAQQPLTWWTLQMSFSVSGFILMLGHCKRCIIVAVVLKKKVHFKFFFFFFFKCLTLGMLLNYNVKYLKRRKEWIARLYVAKIYFHCLSPFQSAFEDASQHAQQKTYLISSH